MLETFSEGDFNIWLGSQRKDIAEAWKGNNGRAIILPVKAVDVGPIRQARDRWEEFDGSGTGVVTLKSGGDPVWQVHDVRDQAFGAIVLPGQGEGDNIFDRRGGKQLQRHFQDVVGWIQQNGGYRS